MKNRRAILNILFLFLMLIPTRFNLNAQINYQYIEDQIQSALEQYLREQALLERDKKAPVDIILGPQYGSSYNSTNPANEVSDWHEDDEELRQRHGGYTIPENDEEYIFSGRMPGTINKFIMKGEVAGLARDHQVVREKELYLDADKPFKSLNAFESEWKSDDLRPQSILLRPQSILTDTDGDANIDNYSEIYRKLQYKTQEVLDNDKEIWSQLKAFEEKTGIPVASYPEENLKKYIEKKYLEKVPYYNLYKEYQELKTVIKEEVENIPGYKYYSDIKRKVDSANEEAEFSKKTVIENVVFVIKNGAELVSKGDSRKVWNWIEGQNNIINKHAADKLEKEFKSIK